MPVYKRGPVYWMSFSVGGRQIRKTTGTKDKKKAQELEAQVRAQLIEHKNAAITGKKPRRIFNEALERWLDGEASALKSFDRLEAHVRQILPYTSAKFLDEIPEAAQTMTSAMLGKGLKPATINQRLAAIRRVLNLAFQWGWVDKELGRKIKLLTPNNERHYYLTLQQVDDLAAACGEASDAILLLAFTGLRRGELMRLQPHNKVDGRIVLAPNTKSGKPRVIPLPLRVMHIDFPIKISAPVLRNRFDAARVVVGLPHLHLHDLRHTYASIMIQIGTPIAVVSKLLGHAHIGVTSRYLHLDPQHLDTAISALDLVQKKHSEKAK